ncbi:hypothetical protein [Candidatus Nanohalococcus occultus]|uniref:hypothetical protein n=1 Tax=Candidatus Nanohalococcus occultus TaxID=2978047 RepID=UPI0039E0E3FE
MIAGIILKDNIEEKSVIAFLDEEIECFEVSTNDELVEKLDEKKPGVVAVDAPMEVGPTELNEGEKELKEEGHIFTPSGQQKTTARRLEALQDQAFNVMGGNTPDFIRFDPHITAEELALDTDEALKSIGVEASNIRGAEQFDAVLGAITARFYEQNQFEEMGVVVPEALDEE